MSAYMIVWYEHIHTFCFIEFYVGVAFLENVLKCEFKLKQFMIANEFSMLYLNVCNYNLTSCFNINCVKIGLLLMHF